MTTTSYDDRPFMPGDRISWRPDLAQPGDPTYVVIGPAPEFWVRFAPEGDLDDPEQLMEAAPDELVHVDDGGVL